MDPRAFYSTHAHPPPLGLAVRVIWGGRGPFEAARVTHPQTRAVRWLTYDNGEAVFLPCEDEPPRDRMRSWAGWHTIKGPYPELWQPKRPDLWQLTVPPPAWVAPADFDLHPRRRTWQHNERAWQAYRTHGGQGPSLEGVSLWSSRQSFDAVAAAAEMEGDREAARAGSPRAGRRGQKRELWWLADASGELKWGPPGRITKREAEGRIMRALASEVFSRGADGLGIERSHLLQELSEDDAQSLAEIEEGDGVPIFTPTGQDEDDYDAAMSWFTALGVREASPIQLASSSGRRSVRQMTQRQRVLLFSSRLAGLSYADIGRAMRVPGEKPLSRARVGQLIQAALEAIWISANAFRDDGAIVQHQALERLRTGNRRARRGR